MHCMHPLCTILGFYHKAHMLIEMLCISENQNTFSCKDYLNARKKK